MKKTYIAPNMEMENVKIQSLLTTVSGGGIGNGGEGDASHDPESRRRGRGRNVWDDDEEDF